MLPAGPMALYTTFNGQQFFPTPGRVYAIFDESGNANDGVGVPTGNQGYYRSDGPQPWIHLPRVTNAGGSYTVAESYNQLPASWNINTNGTPAAVTPKTNDMAGFAVVAYSDVEQLSAISQRIILGATGNAGAFYLKENGAGAAMYHDGTTARAFPASYIPSLGWQMYLWIAKSTGVNLYTNARANLQQITATLAANNFGASPWIGGKGATNTYAQMNWKMLALWNRSNHSNAEIDDIFASAGEQCNITTPTLAIHGDGDSVSFGSGATIGGSYPNFLPLRKDWVWHNNASGSGRKWSDMTTDAPTKVDPFHQTGIDNALFAASGANDLNFGGLTIAQTQTNATTYITARRAAKTWKAIGTAGICPAFASQNTFNAFNNVWRANFKAMGFDFMFDGSQWPKDRPLFGYNGNLDITKYYSDNVHPNNYGNKVLAHGWMDCLTRFLKGTPSSDAPWFLT